jgi:hypothetical protein
MSAPDTNVEKQRRRHIVPLIGITCAVIFALVLLFLQMVDVAEDGTPADNGAAEIDGRTGNPVPGDDLPPAAPAIPDSDLPPAEVPVPDSDVPPEDVPDPDGDLPPTEVPEPAPDVEVPDEPPVPAPAPAP